MFLTRLPQTSFEDRFWIGLPQTNTNNGFSTGLPQTINRPHYKLEGLNPLLYNSCLQLTWSSSSFRSGKLFPSTLPNLLHHPNFNFWSHLMYQARDHSDLYMFDKLGSNLKSYIHDFYILSLCLYLAFLSGLVTSVISCLSIIIKFLWTSAIAF